MKSVFFVRLFTDYRKSKSPITFSAVVLLYRFSLYIYRLVVHFAGRFFEKAREFEKGRINQFSRLENAMENTLSPRIWLHVSSLGEFEQGWPVVQRLKKLYPEHKWIVSFFSPSGFKRHERNEAFDYVCYLPMDSPANARRFVDLVKPEMAFFVKYDIWYFYLKVLATRQIATYFVSSTFRPGQFLFWSSDSFFLPVLRKVTHFFVQDEASKRLLSKKGIQQVTVTGDSRFDRVLQRAEQPLENLHIAAFRQKRKLIVLGSVWDTDMELIRPSLASWSDQACLLIAPHEISKSELRHYNDIQGLVRYSEITGQSGCAMVLLDRIGLLADAYQYATVAYVGGAFRGAVHNILEPAAFGVPVIFGSHENNQNFPEVTALIKTGGGFSVSSQAELNELMNLLLQDEDYYRQASEAARRFVVEHAGASDRIVHYFEEKALLK